MARLAIQSVTVLATFLVSSMSTACNQILLLIWSSFSYITWGAWGLNVLAFASISSAHHKFLWNFSQTKFLYKVKLIFLKRQSCNVTISEISLSESYSMVNQLWPNMFMDYLKAICPPTWKSEHGHLSQITRDQISAPVPWYVPITETQVFSSICTPNQVETSIL